jgi:hypothetical protein
LLNKKHVSSIMTPVGTTWCLGESSFQQELSLLMTLVICNDMTVDCPCTL